MSAHPRRAVSLDALGTLVELEPPAPRLVSALAARGVEIAPADAERAFRAEITYYLEHHLEGRDARSLDDLRDRCAAVLEAELGVTGLRDPMLASLRFRAFDDAVPALTDLRARGLALVVVSNWDCSLPGVLEEAGLLGLVDGVVSSADAGAAKPDPRPFRRGLQLVGAPPAEALHVGDSPRNDVDGARAAGLQGLLLAREGGGAIRSLRELAYLI
jgi:putative hydrolase of the HAD superfamily